MNNATKNEPPKAYKIKSVVLKIVRFILWGLVVLLSCFAVISTFAMCNNTNLFTAKADSVETQYQFYGSNIWLECQQMKPANFIPVDEGNRLYSFRWSFSTLQGNESIRFAFSAAYTSSSSNMLSMVSASSFVWSNPGDGGLTNEVQLTLKNNPGGSSVVGYYILPLTSDDLNTNATYCNILITNSGDNILTANIVRVDMGNEHMYDGFYNGHTYNLPSSYYNFIRYVDINGNFVELQFPVSASSPYTDSFLLKPRTYFLITNLTNNDYYQQGINDGIAIGEVNKNEYGSQQFQDGYEAGKDYQAPISERIGYNKGWAEASENQFSFGWFLQSTLNILDVKIFGLFSLGDILAVVLGVTLVIIVLKIFAGG